MEGDAALLRRMLDNLIRNSIVHNPQGCHISVTVGAEDGRCTCTVTDDGVGMDAARLGRRETGGEGKPLQGRGPGPGPVGGGIRDGSRRTVQFRQLPQGLEVSIVFSTSHDE